MPLGTTGSDASPIVYAEQLECSIDPESAFPNDLLYRSSLAGAERLTHSFELSTYDQSRQGVHDLYHLNQALPHHSDLPPGSIASTARDGLRPTGHRIRSLRRKEALASPRALKR